MLSYGVPHIRRICERRHIQLRTHITGKGQRHVVIYDIDGKTGSGAMTTRLSANNKDIESLLACLR